MDQGGEGRGLAGLHGLSPTRYLALFSLMRGNEKATAYGRYSTSRTPASMQVVKHAVASLFFARAWRSCTGLEVLLKPALIYRVHGVTTEVRKDVDESIP